MLVRAFFLMILCSLQTAGALSSARALTLDEIVAKLQPAAIRKFERPLRGRSSRSGRSRTERRYPSSSTALATLKSCNGWPTAARWRQVNRYRNLVRP